MKHVIFISFYQQLIPRNELMARTLKERGWRVSVITWNRGHRRAAPGIVSDGVDAAVAIDLYAAAGTARLLLKMPALYRAMLRAASGLGPADVTVLTHFFLLPLAWRLPPAAGLRVYDASEFFCLDIADYFGPAARLARPGVRALERLLLRRVVATLVTDSRDGWFARFYEAMGQTVHATFNVPSLADDPPADEASAGAALYPGRRVVAYVGGFKPAKGVLTTLRAAAEVRKHAPDVLFLFIGTWQRGRAEIERVVADLGLRGHVRFQDPMPYRDMLAHLRCARVGVALLQGRRNELAGAGGSRKIFSYMQAGLPMVASRTGEVCTIVEQAGCGTLVDVDSPGQIVEALVRYLTDRDLAQRHGAAGRAAFANRYNWQHESRGFVEFIERLGERPPAAQARLA